MYFITKLQKMHDEEFDVSVNKYKLHAVEFYIQFHTGNIIEAEGG